MRFLSGLFVLNLALVFTGLGYVTGTCTQYSADEMVSGVILGAPAFLVAFGLLLWQPRPSGGSSYLFALVFGATALLLATLQLRAGIALLSINPQGYALCRYHFGELVGDAEADDGDWGRIAAWFYPGTAALALLLLASCAWRTIRAVWSGRASQR